MNRPDSPPPSPPRPPKRRRWLIGFLLVALAFSVAVNFYLYEEYRAYFSDGNEPIEQYYSGSETSTDKIAVIMPPNPDRILRRIRHAKEDPDVKAVLLSIDSPGGAVADSHEIYHRIKELRESKPVAVHMKSMAASGGLYVAMGAGTEGKIFAEPTTWTGSIGVIIPRMQMIGLADKMGLESKPIKTGPFKDALSPFRELTPDEQAVWDNIIDQAFYRFIGVIAENRPELDVSQVRELATGEVYTADDALKNRLIDSIGYEEAALDDLYARIDRKAEDIRVITYESSATLVEILLGTAQAGTPDQQWQFAMESTVPRPMYCCSWLAGLTSGRFGRD